MKTDKLPTYDIRHLSDANLQTASDLCASPTSGLVDGIEPTLDALDPTEEPVNLFLNAR